MTSSDSDSIRDSMTRIRDIATVMDTLPPGETVRACQDIRHFADAIEARIRANR